jgi:hypothetical protein
MILISLGLRCHNLSGWPVTASKQSGFYIYNDFQPLNISSLVYRLGYGPFKAESGVRFPDEEKLFTFIFHFKKFLFLDFETSSTWRNFLRWFGDFEFDNSNKYTS